VEAHANQTVRLIQQLARKHNNQVGAITDLNTPNTVSKHRKPPRQKHKMIQNIVENQPNHLGRKHEKISDKNGPLGPASETPSPTSWQPDA
jgi:hypothetical protein